MTKLEPKIHDDSNGLDYVLVGDYYIPTLELDENNQLHIGKWGNLHRRYLKEVKPTVFNELLLSGKLNSYLHELDVQADQRYRRIIEQMKQCEDVTEKLKSKDQMEWVRRMNSICSRAEEIIKHELIYC